MGTEPAPGHSHYGEKWLRGVWKQESEEDIWVQDESMGRWRKWHNKDRGGDIIITNLKEKGKEGMDWIHLAQDRAIWWAVVNTVMNLTVP